MFLKPILKIPYLIDGKTDTTAVPSYVHMYNKIPTIPAIPTELC